MRNTERRNKRDRQKKRGRAGESETNLKTLDKDKKTTCIEERYQPAPSTISRPISSLEMHDM